MLASRRSRFYRLSLGLYCLALLSKTTACTMPAALLLSLWLKKLPIDRKRWGDIVPFLLLGLAMGLLTMRWEDVHQGTVGSDLGLSMADRLLIASRALWFYLGKLLWPSQLSFVYTQWKIDSSDPRQYFWLLACALAAFSLWYWRERLGRGTVAAAAFYVATLSPLHGFFSLYTFHYTYVMDHYQYVASVGPIALAAGGARLLSNRMAKSWRAPASFCAVAVVLGILGTLTWRQCHIYENVEVLWRDTLKKNPECWMAYNNLATIRLNDGRYEESIPLLRESLRIKPDHHKALSNLGLAEIQEGRMGKAVKHLRRAIELEPGRAEYHNNLGNAVLGLGRIQEAIGHYRRAVELAPYYLEALWNLSSALAQSGHTEEAGELRRKYMSLKDREREILGR
jgi:tetratricopeptide (TPR) repeat protein